MADGMFTNYTPWEMQQAYAQQVAGGANASPYERIGARLGTSLGALFGGRTAAEARQSKMQDIMGQVSGIPDTTERLTTAAKLFRQSGMETEASQLEDKAVASQTAQMNMGLSKLKYEQAQAEAGRQQSMRSALAALPPDASEEQMLQAITPHANADDLIKILENKQNKKTAAQQAIALKQMQLDANMEAAKQKGADAKQIAQMQMEGRLQIAAMANETRKALIEAKGPSATQLKAEEQQQSKEEGKVALTSSLNNAASLVNELTKLGGMTTTQASKASNLMTAMSSGTIGQTLGSWGGTETQSKRAELKSLHLQLLSDITQARGMKAGQMNSDTELKTWLNSLGSEGMTKEANLAILENIRKRFLPEGNSLLSAPKKESAVTPAVPVGTKENPIKLGG